MAIQVQKGSDIRTIDEGQLSGFLKSGFTQVQDPSTVTSQSQLDAAKAFANQIPGVTPVQESFDSTSLPTQPVATIEVPQAPKVDYVGETMARTEPALESAQQQAQQGFDEIKLRSEQLAQATAEREAAQQETSAFRQRLMGLSEKLGLSGQRQLQIEQDLGIPDQLKNLQEANLQLTQLQNQLRQKGISDLAAQEEVLQGQGLVGQISGRGQQLARTQAIQQAALASQVEGQASIVQALQGNISMARESASRAVELEFAPLAQELQTKLGLLSSVEADLTKAEKKEADAQRDIINAQLAELERKRADKQTITNFALDALTQGANLETVNQLRTATTLDDAIGIAAQSGIFAPSQLDTLKAQLDLRKQQIEIEQLEQELGGVRLSETQRDTLFKLRAEAKNDLDIKGYVDIRDSYDRVLASATNPSPATDLALIFNYMKILDPGSIVRESEQATVQNTGSIPERIWAKYNEVLEGTRLTAEQRADFLNAAKLLAEPKKKNYEQAVGFYQKEATLEGLPVERVIRDFLTPSSEEISTTDLKNVFNTSGITDDFGNPLSYDEAIRQVGGEDNLRKILELDTQNEPFKQDLSMSEKGSVLGLGQVTGLGSPYWKHGLDIDLKIGDNVPTPSSGKVVFAGVNGGFGNQVRVQTPQGNVLWFSHLSELNVKEGDTISAGQVIGLGGNTGNVIPGEGGDGSHLDLTITRPDGTYFTPEEILNRLT